MAEADYEPLAAAHEAAIRSAFSRQPFLTGLDARVERAGRGYAQVAIAATSGQENGEGGVHTGVVAALAESAGQLAVLATLPMGARCRIVEHKVDYAGAMAGGRIVATARMLRPGGSLSVVRIEAVGVSGGQGDRKLAVMLATYLHDARG